MNQTENIEFITEKAAEGCSLNQIANLLGFDEFEFAETVKRTPQMLIAYKQGVALTAAAIQKRVIDFAIKGSPVAQQQYIDILKNQISTL